MTLDYAIAAVVSALLGAYLLYALVRAERF
jgi:K+-transporting ATPase KdpF subunit